MADVFEYREGQGLCVPFRGSGEYRAGTQIIRAGCFGRQRLFHRAGGNTDDGARPEQFPRLFRRHISLTEVYAVCAGFECDIRAVIDDERHSVLRTKLLEFCRLLNQL